MHKKTIKFNETEIEKHIQYQYLEKFLLVKRVLNVLFVTKIVKKLVIHYE